MSSFFKSWPRLDPFLWPFQGWKCDFEEAGYLYFYIIDRYIPCICNACLYREYIYPIWVCLESPSHTGILPRNGTPLQSLPICVAVSYSPTMIDDLFKDLHRLHLWKLTWNLKITHLRRKIIFQTSTFGVPSWFSRCSVAAANLTKKNMIHDLSVYIIKNSATIWVQ